MHTDPTEQRRILRRTLERALRQHTAIKPAAAVALTETVWRIIGPALEQRDTQLAAAADIAAGMDATTGARFWAQQLHAALGTRPGRALPPVSWCGASMPGIGGEPIGPCVLRAGHDGPVHQAANGTKWWPRDLPDQHPYPAGIGRATINP